MQIILEKTFDKMFCFLFGYYQNVFYLCPLKNKTKFFDKIIEKRFGKLKYSIYLCRNKNSYSYGERK